jgi:hypothetical protein
MVLPYGMVVKLAHTIFWKSVPSWLIGKEKSLRVPSKYSSNSLKQFNKSLSELLKALEG